MKGAHFKRRAEGRQFLWHNVVAGMSTAAGGLLGFALQSLSTHAMRPANYGKAFAVATLFSLLTRPGAAFSRLVTWNTSRERAVTGKAGQASGLLLRDMTWQLLVVGTAMAVFSTAAGGVIGGYLHVRLAFVVIGAASIPFSLAGPPLIGELQGEERFVPWAVLSTLVAASRFVFVAVLVFHFGAMGYLVGLTASSVFTFFVTLVIVMPGMRGLAGRFKWRPVVRFIIVAIVSSITVSVYLGVDVVMVAHFFDKTKGGLYGVAAVLGRSVFFATGGVASVQFPKVATRHAKGKSTLGVVGASLALVAAVGLVTSAFLQFFGRLIIHVFAGKSYLPAAHLVGWYGFGMMFLSAAVVLVNTQQSLNEPGLLWVLVPMAFVEPLFILAYHTTLLDVVVASDLSNVVFVAILVAVYLRGEAAGRRARAGEEAPDSAPVVIPAAI